MARIAALTVASFALLAVPASAALPAGNLVKNPGAEAGAGASGDETVAPPEWRTTPTFTAIKYSVSGSPAPPGGTASGMNYFAGGSNAQESSGIQTIDLTPAAAEIDAGKVTALLSADLGGFGDQADDMRVTLTFRAVAGGDPTGTITIGPVTPAERGNVTKLISKAGQLAVPPGSRIAEVLVLATRAAGVYNDGYADNVSLTMPAAQAAQPSATPPPAFGPTGVVTLPSNKQCVSRRNFRIHIHKRRGRTYEEVSVFVNGKKVKTVKGKKLSAPVDLRGLPKGQFTVKIVILTTKGEVIQGTRKYRTCEPKRKA